MLPSDMHETNYKEVKKYINSPHSNIKSSSVSVKGRAACGRFTLPKSRTNSSFLRKGLLDRDKENSWSFRILGFEQWSFRYRCRLR